jgi:hypothetical protein
MIMSWVLLTLVMLLCIGYGEFYSGNGFLWVWGDGGCISFVSFWLYRQGRSRGFYMRGISVLDEHSQNNK